MTGREVVTPGREEREALSEALNDADCRRILVALGDGPMTAAELSEACDVPLSSVYRKIDRLLEASLLAESMRLRPTGRNTREFERRVDEIAVRFAGADGDDGHRPRKRVSRSP